MAPKNYYQLLEIAPTAPADEVRRAFRLQIARYHPDKVQHLGEEFQAMAVGRATELTEAYRVLSDPGRRADYDRAVAAGEAATSPPAAPPSQDVPPPQGPAAPPPDAGAPCGASVHAGASEPRRVRAQGDGRSAFAQALHALGGYEETEVRGFDLSFTTKSKLFARTKGPRLLARFVGTVDPDAVADTWAQVGRLNLPSGEDACVFLMGSAMSSPRELAGAIAEQRRRPCRGVEADSHSDGRAQLGRARAARCAAGGQGAAGAPQDRRIMGTGGGRVSSHLRDHGTD